MTEPATAKLPLSAGERAALAALVLGGVCIGFAPIFARLADVGPFAMGAWRMAIASAAAAALTAGARGLPRAAPDRRELALIALTGILFAGDLGCFFLALERTSVAHATLIVNLAPVLTVLGGWALFGERPRPATLAGLATALAGAALLALGARAEGSVSTLAGNAFALAAAAFYAAYLLAVKQARITVASDHLLLGSGLAAALVLLPLAAMTGEALVPQGWPGLAALLALGLVGHAAGQGLIAKALARLAVGFSSIVLLIQPTVAALAAWALFGEALGAGELVGAGLILLGIALAGRAR